MLIVLSGDIDDFGVWLSTDTTLGLSAEAGACLTIPGAGRGRKPKNGRYQGL